MTKFEQRIFDELGLVDGDEITCSIDGQFIGEALFRVGKNSRIYIEQDHRNGSPLLNGDLRFLQYKYSWVCEYLFGEKRFTNNVTKVKAIKSPLFDLFKNNIFPVSIPMPTQFGIRFNTKIIIPNTDIIISDCDGETYDKSISNILLKYNNYLKTNDNSKT